MKLPATVDIALFAGVAMVAAGVRHFGDHWCMMFIGAVAIVLAVVSVRR